MAGTLYIVATPIGNLEDISYRALRILREVDWIACEDTRHTRRLLEHYGIRKPALSYHDHNEKERSEDLIARLDAGSSIALVSDAGTPLISDPGFRVVSEATARGIPVVSIPGPNAGIAALAASGLPTDSFYFGGFLPSKTGQRQKVLMQKGTLDCTLIFYEAPHRVRECLDDVDSVLGGRPVALCRELTKLHEEWLRGTAAEIRLLLDGRPEIKGEITLLIGKGDSTETPSRSVPEAYRDYLSGGLSRMEAIKAVAREQGVSKREVYSQLEMADD